MFFRIRNKRNYQKWKESARFLVFKKVEDFNRIYGFTYNRIFIRNQKTRWGSCSSNKNLGYNYKIIFLPEPCADYLIVHELCHLGEFNHSSRFWELVAHTVPDYKEKRKLLRRF